MRAATASDTRSERAAREIIALHSKSFALAARLLPRSTASDATVLYAYCRRVDDAIDLAPPGEHAARLRQLRSELDLILAGGAALQEPLLEAFRSVVQRRRIPRAYLDELLLGLEMDADRVSYATFDGLEVYCYRVAGTVGLMMCHVMMVRHAEALVHAAHLGVAMQLTNIARDVLEDWQRGRLYLPDDLLARGGAPDLRQSLGEPFPRWAVPATARATELLLDRADAYYRSGDAGLRHLSSRCGLAVRTARLVYSRIGHRIRAQGCDPLAGRAIVSGRRKLALAIWAAVVTGLSLPAAALRPRARMPKTSVSGPAAVPPPVT